MSKSTYECLHGIRHRLVRDQAVLAGQVAPQLGSVGSVQLPRHDPPDKAAPLLRVVRNLQEPLDVALFQRVEEGVTAPGVSVPAMDSSVNLHGLEFGIMEFQS